jgi:hypothetical protein
MSHRTSRETLERTLSVSLAFAISIVSLGFDHAVAEAADALSSARADPDGPRIVARAREMGLAQSLEWQRLLHYRPDPWGSPVSEVDGQEFFLAPSGKHDPEAELEATLIAFLAPIASGQEDAHALCRFPARRLWLDERLHFEGILHAPTCPALARYNTALEAESVAVVYSANYLNNPASAFGHTFLRLKKRRLADATEPSERLDYGIDYIAITDTNNPVLYAFKGLTGLFPGGLHFHSFEYKMREYGNYEARDLWEYDLTLTPGEVTLLALHLWELASTHIDYFYLTKNCSYYVLAAIEAAAPRLDLISRLHTVVLPKDTIKVLFGVPGLVRGVYYRPSLRSRFRAQVARLGPKERDTAQRLALDPTASMSSDLSVAESVAALDAAVLVLDARFAKPTESSEDGKVAAAKAWLVQRRALLSTSLPPPPPVPVPFDKAPERGHGSIRVTLGTGITTQYGDDFGTLGYRLTLHDLVDPAEGEPELSQLQFFDAHVRYDLARRALTLDSLTFADVLALNPLTRFEKAASWRARAFGVRLHDRGCPDCFAHGLDGAVGGTIATDNERAAFFLMADIYAAFSGSLDGIGGSFVRVGVGPYAGLRVRLPGETIGLLTASWSYLPAQNLRGTYDLRAILRASLGKDVALGVETAMQPYSSEVQLSSYLYF